MYGIRLKLGIKLTALIENRMDRSVIVITELGKGISSAPRAHLTVFVDVTVDESQSCSLGN